MKLTPDFLTQCGGERPCIKAFYHLAKLLELQNAKFQYLQKLHIVRNHLNEIDFEWEDGKVYFTATNKPKYWQIAFVDVLSPSKLRKGKGKALYCFAKSSKGILGWIRFTAPPQSISPRGIIIPALKGNGRSKDGLQERRGIAINHFLWSNKSQAWGRFRKSRGLKTLYMSVFDRTLYPTISELWHRMPLAIEATTLYGISSSVFRNLKPLAVFSSTTAGFSSIHTGEELFRAWKDGKKRSFLKHDLFCKGYYLITPFPNLPEVIHHLVYDGKLPDAILLDRATILGKLKPTDGGYEDKEYILQYLEVEERALQEIKDPIKAFEILREFHAFAYSSSLFKEDTNHAERRKVLGIA